MTDILSQGLLSGEAEQSNYEKEFLEILYTSGKKWMHLSNYVFEILCLFYFDGRTILKKKKCKKAKWLS